MSNLRSQHVVLLAVAAVAAACAPKQAARTPEPTAAPGGVSATPPGDSALRAAMLGGGGAPGGAAGGGIAEPNPRPYARVITPQAKSRDGLFKTHRIGGRLLFEIPRGVQGRDILVVPRVAKAPVGGTYGGQQAGQARIVRWERRENRILLRAVSYSTVADSLQPIAQAVLASNFSPILAAFNVEAYGGDSAAVIDVTRLFTAPPTEIGPGVQFRGTPDPTRSFIDRVLSFPTNVEVEALLTVAPPPQGVAAPPPSPFGGAGPAGTQSLIMHWSMVKLPDVPMMARVEDTRVGYFATRNVDYGRPEQRAERRSYILRYRLEKKDPNAAVSDPVKPIVYYVDPATPDWLKPYVRKGIEAWQKAFLAAGFSNAIVARDAPTVAQDPDWSPEDARYSVIRWLPSTIENAQGPNVNDPRSGEILEADVYMYHNIMNLQRSWYFSQVGHLDARARMWPFPDTLMGRLVEYVVAHEVGHTLGFPHNQKASSTYPVDSVRSKSFVKRMGHTPTLMDYSRFNYTAQPEDGIELPDLIPNIGPYDEFVTMWGYKPIPSAKTPDDERATLNAWAREQDAKPWLRFNVPGSNGSDAGDQTEAVGDEDAVKATGWGIKNIKRIVPLITPATVRDGEDFADLSEIYGRVIGQWATELRHVTNVVGGAQSQEKYGGQEGPRFAALPRRKQKEAVKFLNDNAFATPSFFLDGDILRRIEVEGALRRINQAQNGILHSLFSDRRLERMIEFDALATKRDDSYTLGEMLSDVRGGIWRELSSGTVKVDAFRRELQRSYLNAARNKIAPPPVVLPAGLPPEFAAQFASARVTSDVRSLFRSELRALDTQLRTAIPRATDRTTRAHLEDARDQVAKILNPEGR